MSNSYQFNKACIDRDIELAKWIYYNNEINLYYNDSCVYDRIFKNNDIEMIKFIFTIYDNKYDLFKKAIIYSKLDIIKWIYINYNIYINITENSEEILDLLCSYNRYDIIKYFIKDLHIKIYVKITKMKKWKKIMNYYKDNENIIYI
jgi:hypothetical protein